MTKKITGAVLALLMALLMVPVMAFAEDAGHKMDTLVLTAGDHSDKTLETDGYMWDGENAVLTIQDLTITETVILPSQDCTICVKGVCSIGGLSIGNSDGAVQNVTIQGEGKDRSTLRFLGNNRYGNLVLNDLTVNDGDFANVNENNQGVLELNNSNVTLAHLGWMTNDGIRLTNSELHMKKTAENQNGQFWTEKIIMDEVSVIESMIPLRNRHHCTLTDFESLNSYIDKPVGGYFALYRDFPTAVDQYITIVVEKDENGKKVEEQAEVFTLKAPDAAQPEQPAEDDPVKEPENTHERPVRRFSNAPAAVEEAPKTVEAAKTGDMGVALYAVSAVLSAAGMAWVGKKHGR